MRILSFDVGIKNLSFCDIEYESSHQFCIHDWQTIDITNGVNMDMHCTAEALIKYVQDKFLCSTNVVYDHILIENQPVMKNPTMKSVQMVLYTSFKYHQILHQAHCNYRVHFISALNKNKCLKLIDKEHADAIVSAVDASLETSTSKNKEYVKRKKLSIEIAKHLLNQRNSVCDDHALATLQKQKKQDDLADNFNQAIFFAHAL